MAKIRPTRMATGFWEYRTLGGQLARISVNSITPRDSFHSVVEAPTVEIAEGDTDVNADSYLWDGTKFRKGTAGEIAAFATSATADKSTADKAAAKVAFVSRRELVAFVELLIDEINILRGQHSLANRTKNQFVTAFNNKVDAST